MKKSRVQYRMRCDGCGDEGLHYPNAKKCNVCGGKLVISQTVSRQKPDKRFAQAKK